jgi:HipA-like protein
MWNALKRRLLDRWTEGKERIETPKEYRAEFVLQYDGLDVGHLKLQDGQWVFTYTDAFRQQSEIKPLLEFPDPVRTYRALDLWPFFRYRIPSIAQPQVKEQIEREHLDEHNAAQLLDHFGRRTAANPFVLESVGHG